MKTPFTADQFFEVFKSYNEAVYPAQFMLYIVSFIALYRIVKPTSNAGKIISGSLAFFWLWMGSVYHLIYFSPINSAAYVFGTVFILQGVLFLFYGVFQNKITFSFHPDRYGIAGMILILFALIIYPVFGILLGHRYPASPTFGLPCPTTIFTFGVLLLSDKKVPVLLLIIPLLWSVIGFTAALNFGVWEDTGLLIAGLATAILMNIKNRSYRQE